jgi:SpoVK/Ycf46/Vps4 family AAA+-type ATPase
MHDKLSDIEVLARLFRTGHPLVWISTSDESEALDAVRQAAVNDGRGVYLWSCVQGVSQDLLAGSAPEDGTEGPIVGLARMAQLIRDYGPTGDPQAFAGTGRRAPVLVMLDLMDHLSDVRVMRVFRDVAARVERDGAILVLVDHRSEGPPILGSLAHRVELSLPDEAEIDRIIRATLRDLHQKRPIRIDLKRSELETAIRNLRGLSRRQIVQIIRDVVIDDRAFDADDLPAIIAAKRRSLAGSGMLEHVEALSGLDQIGGMKNLKRWLLTREGALVREAAEFGLTPPRGVLLLGVQGAGKSLCAKAIAAAWHRPLMRMNVGALYDRFVGQSEKQLREALRQAEAMSPVVLWIDEIEKGFASAASQSTDGGLSKRLFGELLTWLQEHRAPVFTVATANDIEALPPELLRKGRFDEIFFVDLPGPDARREILRIHLKRKKRAPENFDLHQLVELTEGYSGSEIEQAILSALHDAYATKSDMTTESLARAIAGSPPLSVTMAERIADLREWAQRRCVPAE